MGTSSIDLLPFSFSLCYLVFIFVVVFVLFCFGVFWGGGFFLPVVLTFLEDVCFWTFLVSYNPIWDGPDVCHDSEIKTNKQTNKVPL